MTSLLLVLSALFLQAGPARAAVYHPEALVAVGDRAQASAERGATPIVILDLDDTLTDSRTRTTRILLELAHDPSAPLDGETRDALSSVTPPAIAYDLSDTLRALGLSDPVALAAADSYWKQRFFSDAYVRIDEPVRGAPEYTRWLVARGAKLVYLTGRPAETMRDGTIENLERNGFPPAGVAGDGQEPAVLIMKPRVQDDDLAFKKAAFERIATLGEVVGVFENEPRNINAMHAAFPGAVAIFVDTIHSKRPDVPAGGIAWVRDFSPEF